MWYELIIKEEQVAIDPLKKTCKNCETCKSCEPF